MSMSMYIHTYSATVSAAAELYTVGFTTALFYNNHLIYSLNKILTNNKVALLISQAFLHSVYTARHGPNKQTTFQQIIIKMIAENFNQKVFQYI